MDKEYKNLVLGCQNCNKDFIIEPDDFLFYEKIKVPAPTFCSECRMIRRMNFRNERTLYHRICDLCKKNIISIYNPTSLFIVYCHECFYSDKWDPLSYGLSYDFSKTFFEQFNELQLRAPKLCNQKSNSIVNSEYANHVGDVHNCYLAFASVNDEDSSYINYVSYSKNIFDGLRIFKSEFCYECIDCINCENIKYSQLCSNSFDCYFTYNCKSCSNCFMCSNLVSQSYCIRNIKYTKEEYQHIIKKLNFDSYDFTSLLKEEFLKLKKESIHRATEGFNNVNSTGNYLRNTKNCINCFDITDALDSKYVGYGNEVKDTMDAYATYPKTELCYESAATGNPSYDCMFSYLPWSSSFIRYSVGLFSSCQNCFGCNQLHQKSYCILNKQYTKEEYEELVPKIIKHMNDMPYVDKKGRIYKYGEFFPVELSPFAYNETISQQYFPITKEQAIKSGYNWYDKKEINYTITKFSNDLPDDIKNVSDDILLDIIGCEHGGKCNQQCTTAFKITENELSFYRRMNLPLPRLCPNCRHYERLSQRNPMKLWHRACMKPGCSNEFETSYSPERPEIVYCEKCYQGEVY
jgi:hypothetical protein